MKEGFRLDPDKVAAIVAETEQVVSVLSDIFNPDEEVVVVEPEVKPAIDSILSGLDAQHSAFINVLIGRQAWTRLELAQVATEHGLMPDGAIEVVNEAAFEACDDTLLEGSDPIEINSYALAEITAS